MKNKPKRKINQDQKPLDPIDRDFLIQVAKLSFDDMEQQPECAEEAQGMLALEVERIINAAGFKFRSVIRDDKPTRKSRATKASGKGSE